MLSEERIKKLMKEVGLPNSRSLMIALYQAANEGAFIERERCAKIAEKYEPDEKLENINYASCEIRNR